MRAKCMRNNDQGLGAAYAPAKPPEALGFLDIWEIQKSYFWYLKSNETDRISASPNGNINQGCRA